MVRGMKVTAYSDEHAFIASGDTTVIARTAVRAHVDDPSDAHDASAISYDPTYSGLVATDVQAALDELAAGATPGGALTSKLEVIIDGGGAEITTGVKAYVDIPVAMTITGVRLMADQAGDLVVDLWVDDFASYPPTDTDSITAGNEPTLTADASYEDTTLTGWGTALAAGDVLAVNVDSVATVTLVTVSLTLEGT